MNAIGLNGLTQVNVIVDNQAGLVMLAQGLKRGCLRDPVPEFTALASVLQDPYATIEGLFHG